MYGTTTMPGIRSCFVQAKSSVDVAATTRFTLGMAALTIREIPLGVSRTCCSITWWEMVLVVRVV